MTLPPPTFRRTYFIVIFLVSLTMLSAQVTVTRLLSYKLYFHFVFLVISLAQLGIASAGAWIFALGKRLAAHKTVTWGMLGITLATIFFLFGYAWLSPRPNVGMSKINGQTAVPYLIALSVLLVGLYFMSGLVYSSLFSQHKSHFNQLYAADLAGAAVGCLASVGLMWAIGPIKTFLLSALLTALAALLIKPYTSNRKSRILRTSAIALGVLAVILSWFNAGLFDPNARYPTGAIIDFEWNHLARTDRIGPSHYIIDGDASTWVIDPQSEIEYLVAPANPRIAIIGVGAGPQLRVAMNHDPQLVLAVDINPSIINWSVGEDSSYNGGIFNRPEVISAIDEGRHAIRSFDGEFDLIGMHAVDTYTASSGGAYSLSENYLYTVEAFRDFYDHLSPQGVLATRRWLFYPPRENLRLFTTIYQALTEEGVSNPAEHLIVLAPVEDVERPHIKEWGYILLCKQPFSADQLAAVDTYVAENNWSYLHRPGQSLDTPFSEFAYTDNQDQFFTDYPYFVSPSYDANPFFFQFVPPFASLYYRTDLSASLLYNQSTDILFITLALVTVLTLVLLALPLYLRKDALQSVRQTKAPTLYFVCLGVGFMAIELASIQIMTLFLGHPTYALSIVLLGMLACAGIGSIIVKRISLKRARYVGLVICVLAILAGLGLLPLAHSLISSPFWLRVLVTLLYLALISIPLGMPMAIGIRTIGQENKPQVAWAWACNGGAAVIGTNVCMILMVYFGIPIVFFVGSGCYLLAYLTLNCLLDKVQPETSL